MLEAFGIFNVWWEILFSFQIAQPGTSIEVFAVFLVAMIVGWAINILTNYVGKG